MDANKGLGDTITHSWRLIAGQGGRGEVVCSFSIHLPQQDLAGLFYFLFIS